MNPNTRTPGPSMPLCPSRNGRSSLSIPPLVPEQDQHYYSLNSFYDTLPHDSSRCTLQAPSFLSFNIISQNKQQSSTVHGSNSFPFVNMCPRHIISDISSLPMHLLNAVQAEPSMVYLPTSCSSLP